MGAVSWGYFSCFSKGQLGETSRVSPHPHPPAEGGVEMPSKGKMSNPIPGGRQGSSGKEGHGPRITMTASNTHECRPAASTPGHLLQAYRGQRRRWPARGRGDPARPFRTSRELWPRGTVPPPSSRHLRLLARRHPALDSRGPARFLPQPRARRTAATHRVPVLEPHLG